jgi:hypothetical protein
MRDFGGMSHDERRKLFESAAFGRFCGACELEIEPGTLQQLEPPAPDIQATIVGNGPVAFELVCLDDDAYQERFNLMGDAQALTRRYHREMDPNHRAAFDAAFGDAYLMITFVSTAGKRGVRKALPGLFEMLMKLPPGTKGMVFDQHSFRPDGVERLNIARDPSILAPEFTTSSGGMVAPLNLAKLKEKLGNKYQSDVPVELLAYAAQMSRQSDEDSISGILNQLVPMSQFRRVWIFEELLRRATCYERPAI